MFGIGKLRSSPPAAPAATLSLRRIQLFFWLATVLIVGLFASINWVSFKRNLLHLTHRVVTVEREITCKFVRYHIERYLVENQYRELLPGKNDTGLNQLLADLVERNPFITNIRVVSLDRYHVAVGGEIPSDILDHEHKDRCCSPFTGDALLSSAGGVPHPQRPSSPLSVELLGPADDVHGHFHDPETLDVYCAEAALYIGDRQVGQVAIHEDVPLSRLFYDEARDSGRSLIIAASGLLLLALTLAITWTNREVSRLEQRIAEGDRNTSLASLAAGVAHEIRNPLNTIALSCTFLGRKLQEPEARESLGMIASEVTRLQRTIDGFLRFARAPRLELAQVDIDEVIDSTLELLDAELRAHDIAVERQRGAGALTQADRGRLREAFVNLMRNAIQAVAASGRPGRIAIHTRVARRHIQVEVTDSGNGLSEEVRRHVFEPYFTTKDDGLGLGLAQVRQDLRAHGGEIDLENVEGRGARATVTLPLRAAAAAGVASQAQPGREAG